MNNCLQLGALDISSNKYILPSDAIKGTHYKCIECNNRVILRKGTIRRTHYAHYAKTNTCHYYDRPSESQIHKDAKMLLQSLIQNKNNICLKRYCIKCMNYEEYEIPIINDTSIISLEYRFNYNNQTKIADVSYIDSNDIVCIFEIFNTHATNEIDRPEPWFEIDATYLIDHINSNKYNGIYEIKCRRYFKCDECIEQEIKQKELENKLRLELERQRKIAQELERQRKIEYEERQKVLESKRIRNSLKLELFKEIEKRKIRLREIKQNQLDKENLNKHIELENLPEDIKIRRFKFMELSENPYSVLNLKPKDKINTQQNIKNIFKK